MLKSIINHLFEVGSNSRALELEAWLKNPDPDLEFQFICTTCRNKYPVSVRKLMEIGTPICPECDVELELPPDKEFRVGDVEFLHQESGVRLTMDERVFIIPHKRFEEMVEWYNANNQP